MGAQNTPLMNIDELEKNLNQYLSSNNKAIAEILNIVAHNQAMIDSLMEMVLMLMYQGRPDQEYNLTMKDLKEEPLLNLRRFKQ